MAGNFIDRMSVNGNSAAGYIVEAHQQVDKGGLSTASRTDDRDTFARFCMEIEVFNQFFIRNIAEADMINIDLAFASVRASFGSALSGASSRSAKILVAHASAF